jgi:hypothetical protein
MPQLPQPRRALCWPTPPRPSRRHEVRVVVFARSSRRMALPLPPPPPLQLLLPRQLLLQVGRDDDRHSVRSYADCLSKLFVLSEQTPLRPPTALRRSQRPRQQALPPPLLLLHLSLLQSPHNKSPSSQFVPRIHAPAVAHLISCFFFFLSLLPLPGRV